jgi:hypothetical protein
VRACVCVCMYPCPSYPTRKPHLFSVICGLSCSTIIFHIISQTADFRNKNLNIKCVFWFYLQLLPVTFFFLRRILRDIINMPSQVAAPSEAGTAAVRLLGLRVRIPPRASMCLLWVLCLVRYMSLWQADFSSIGVLPSVVCLRQCDREASTMRHWPTRGRRTVKTNIINLHGSSYKVPVLLVRI